jgi:hypothetical protein
MTATDPLLNSSDQPIPTPGSTPPLDQKTPSALQDMANVPKRVVGLIEKYEKAVAEVATHIEQFEQLVAKQPNVGSAQESSKMQGDIALAVIKKNPTPASIEQLITSLESRNVNGNFTQLITKLKAIKHASDYSLKVSQDLAQLTGNDVFDKLVTEEGRNALKAQYQSIIAREEITAAQEELGAVLNSAKNIEADVNQAVEAQRAARGNPLDIDANVEPPGTTTPDAPIQPETPNINPTLPVEPVTPAGVLPIDPHAAPITVPEVVPIKLPEQAAASTHSSSYVSSSGGSYTSGYTAALAEKAEATIEHSKNKWVAGGIIAATVALGGLALLSNNKAAKRSDEKLQPPAQGIA